MTVTIMDGDINDPVNGVDVPICGGYLCYEPTISADQYLATHPGSYLLDGNPVETLEQILQPPSGFALVDSAYMNNGQAYSGDAEFSEHHFYTVDILSLPTAQWSAVITDAFARAAAGGTPIAWALFRRPIFNIDIPQKMCSPSWVPFFGGDCVSVPFGGMPLVTGYEYALTMVYYGSPAAIALGGSLWAALLVIGIVLIIILIGSGVIHIPPSLGGVLNNLTPGGTAGSVTTAFIVAAVAFGVIALVLPTIQPHLGETIRAGPTTTTLGVGPQPRTSRRR